MSPTVTHISEQMQHGLFENWLAIERKTGKTMTAFLHELNTVCGTKYRHNWPSIMAERGHKLDRLPSNVRLYMMVKVLPVALGELGISLSPDQIDRLAKQLS